METGAGANGVIIKLLMDGLSDNSFPSGHTIAAFEASVTLLCGNRKLRIPTVTMAFLVAFSRLYLSHRCDRIHRAGGYPGCRVLCACRQLCELIG